MSSKSKSKSKTYIVHHRGRAYHGGFAVLGRYRVGAKNEQHAIELVKGLVGKHAKVTVYYEDKNLTTPLGSIITESTTQQGGTQVTYSIKKNK